LPEISRFFGIVIKMFFDGHELVKYKTTSSWNDTGNQVTGVESCTQRKPFTSFFHCGKYRCEQSQVLAGPQRAL